MSKAVDTTKTLVNLESADCRWPLGDPRQLGFHFCGAPQMEGRPYCEHHWKMSMQPSRPRSPTFYVRNAA